MRITSFFIFLTLACLVQNSPAQNIANPDSLAVSFYSPASPEILSADTVALDTSLSRVVLYDPLQREDPFFARGNNKGTASYNLFFNPPTDLNRELITSVIEPYLLTTSNLPVYTLHTPFTRASYSMGSASEQIFEVTHAQPIGIISVGITYRILNSKGAYLRQHAIYGKWGIYLTTSPKLKRFESTLLLARNKVDTIGENGGIAIPAQFEDSSKVRRKLIAVNLIGAYNQWKVNDLRFMASYALVKSNDSLPWNLKLIYDVRRLLTHRIYSDGFPLSVFYQHVYLDSNAALDSCTVINTRQFVGLSLDYKLNKTHFAVRGGLNHEIIDAIVTDSTFKGSGLGFRAQALVERNSHSLTTHYSGVFSGLYATESQFSFSYLYRSKAKNSLTLHMEVFTSSFAVPLMYRHYSGNFARWDTSLDNEVYKGVKARIGFSGWSLGIATNTIDGYQYLSDSLIPVNASSTVQIQQLSLSKNLHLGWFNINNDIRLQSGNSDSIISVPPFLTYHSLSAGFPMFKSALVAYTGCDLRFISSYYPSDYRPDLAAFHPQNDFKTQDYLYIDLWLAIKIKHTRIFIKSEHVNSGMFGYHYYLLPRYPMADRNFVFGVDWIFYD